MRADDDAFIRDAVAFDEPAPRVVVGKVDPVEMPVDYVTADGVALECVVALDEGRAAWVDAWRASGGERVELDADQREAIVMLAVRGVW